MHLYRHKYDRKNKIVSHARARWSEETKCPFDRKSELGRLAGCNEQRAATWGPPVSQKPSGYFRVATQPSHWSRQMTARSVRMIASSASSSWRVGAAHISIGGLNGIDSTPHPCTHLIPHPFPSFLPSISSFVGLLFRYVDINHAMTLSPYTMNNTELTVAFFSERKCPGRPT